MAGFHSFGCGTLIKPNPTEKFKVKGKKNIRAEQGPCKLCVISVLPVSYLSPSKKTGIARDPILQRKSESQHSGLLRAV